MATTVTITELRKTLSEPEDFDFEPFEVLRQISVLLSEPDTESAGREMLLRALDQRRKFDKVSTILDALTRAAGLFPYADPESFGFRDAIAYEFHRPTNMPRDIVFHREQAEVYRRLLAGESLIVSAPTSFGKSRIIDAAIATQRYDNVAVVVPTLALIDESRRRLAAFSGTHKIVSHPSQDPHPKRNIFVFTAERAVAYEKFPALDLFVIDEFYKLGAIQEDPTRTVALNQAFYKLRKKGRQFYLLGPNIKQIPSGMEEAFRCTFFSTSFGTVVTEQIQVQRRGSELESLVALARDLSDPTLIFCSSPGRVNEVADALVEAGVGIDAPSTQSAAKWASSTYHPDWVFGRAVAKGIGIHHGRLPRALAQYAVRAFNQEKLRFLVCTSTLIEGVNTKAKNVVMYDNSIATQEVDYFTFNNIKGRSGRMFQHFVGRVYLFHDPPQEGLPIVDIPVFTQGRSAPDSLLIQLDAKDLSASAKERVKQYSEQSELPIDILKANASIPPDRQIALAAAIRKGANRLWPSLHWRQFPKYAQLKVACELIWQHLVDTKRRSGVFSGSQLAMKVWQMWETPSAAKRVMNELRPGKFAAKSPDEAVERVLQFERNWAGFEVPRYLLALSGIQAYVLRAMGLPYGDYSGFAGQVESLFRAPVLATLDEYGVPIQVAEKIAADLRTADNLDVALARLKSLDVGQLRLGAFERELVVEAQAGL